MGTFKITYSGNTPKFKETKAIVVADNAREAVESFYSENLNYNYFPQEDGRVVNCDGQVIAEADDECIKFDGGYFWAEMVDFHAVLEEKIEESEEVAEELAKYNLWHKSGRSYVFSKSFDTEQEAVDYEVDNFGEGGVYEVKRNEIGDKWVDEVVEEGYVLMSNGVLISINLSL